MARYDGTQATTKHRDAAEKRKQQAYLILDHLRRAASEGHEMTPAAIQAAKIYLSKTLPDLKAIEHSGELDTKPSALEITIKS